MAGCQGAETNAPSSAQADLDSTADSAHLTDSAALGSDTASEPGVELTADQIRFGCLVMGEGENQHAMCNHGHSLNFRSENLWERFEFLTSLGRENLTEADLMMGAMDGMSGGLPDPLTPLIEARVGERIRIRLISYGPEMHDFHVHGHVWKEGAIWKDTEPLMPAQVYDGAEFYAGAGAEDRAVRAGPGDWMYHCHVEPHIASGMWGLFRVHEAPDQAGLADGRYAAELPEPIGADKATVDVWLVAAEVPIAVTREYFEGFASMTTVERLARIYVPLSDQAAFEAATATSVKALLKDRKETQAPWSLVVRLGTRIRMHFRNVMQEAPATLHPHGVAYTNEHDGSMPDDVAWPGGGAIEQEWVADTPGTWPLHDHARTLENLARGLFGAIVVVTPEEEARIERDYLLVFHDFDMDFFMGLPPGASGGHP